MRKFKRFKNAFGLNEYGLIDFPRKTSGIKISRIKKPSKSQLVKKEEAIENLKKISSKNAILEGFISPLIIKTNRKNYGVINRTSPGAFFAELRSEVFHFRNKLLENIQP